MNLLLITFSFPPVGGVGVLRALSLAKYLPLEGVRVDVLTARNAPSVGKDLSLLQQVPAEVTVHPSWTLDLPFALRKGIKKLVGGGKPAAPGAGKPGAPGKGNPLKRLVGNLLLPDPQVGWLPFAFPAARRIIRERKIDAVLITVPPFSSVRLATMLRKAFPTLPIVVDFRDEWLSTTLDLVSFNNNERARTVATKAESEAVRDASAVVLVTEAARQELIGRYPHISPAKFRYIANGYETRDTTQKPRERGEQILLTYIGSVYGSTDPGNVVEAVLALPADLRQKLKLRFIGHVETDALRQSLGRLGDTLELKGFVPRAEALRALEETDYLLLITHDRINVSAKFYDYVSGSRAIVAAVNPGGDVRRLLEETGTGYWADSSSPAEITTLLTRILTGPAEPLQRNEREIAKYHRRALASQYAALLRELVDQA